MRGDDGGIEFSAVSPQLWTARKLRWAAVAPLAMRLRVLREVVMVGALSALFVFGTDAAALRQPLARRALDAGGYLILVLAAVVLLGRVRLPRLTLAVTLVVVGSYLLLGYPYGPVLLAVSVAVFALVDRASTIRVCYRAEELIVEISDDGPGLATDGRRLDSGTGTGLAGMRERAEAVGGHLVFGPGPRGGFQVRARLPLPATRDLAGGKSITTVPVVDRPAVPATSRVPPARVVQYKVSHSGHARSFTCARPHQTVR